MVVLYHPRTCNLALLGVCIQGVAEKQHIADAASLTIITHYSTIQWITQIQ